ncbi:MAG: ribosomal protein S18-alanine N-acetyltransferase [Sphingomonadales bacterium]
MVKIIKDSDLEGVKEAYRIHAASFNPKSADFLSFEGFKDLCSLENASLLVLNSAEKQMVGYVLFRDLGQEAEILSLAVEKIHKKQGFGKKLIQKMITSLKKRGCQAIFLEVGEKNQAARALYRSFGARQIGSRKAYYTSPNGSKEDALLKIIPLR